MRLQLPPRLEHVDRTHLSWGMIVAQSDCAMLHPLVFLRRPLDADDLARSSRQHPALCEASHCEPVGGRVAHQRLACVPPTYSLPAPGAVPMQTCGSASGRSPSSRSGCRAIRTSSGGRSTSTNLRVQGGCKLRGWASVRLGAFVRTEVKPVVSSAACALNFAVNRPQVSTSLNLQRTERRNWKHPAARDYEYEKSEQMTRTRVGLKAQGCNIHGVGHV